MAVSVRGPSTRPAAEGLLTETAAEEAATAGARGFGPAEDSCNFAATVAFFCPAWILSGRSAMEVFVPNDADMLSGAVFRLLVVPAAANAVVPIPERLPLGT